MTKKVILDKVIAILSLIFVFLLPLFFAPFLINAYDLGKQIYLLTFSFILLVLWSVKAVLEKRFTFQKSSFLLILFLVFLSSLASTLINAPNKLTSLASLAGAGNLLILLLAFIIIHNLGKTKLILSSLLASAAVLSVISLILFLGHFTFPLDFPSLNLAVTKAWSPTGSLLAQTIFLLVMVPVGFGLIYEHVKNKNLALGAIFFVANTLILAGLGINFYLLTTVAKAILLPQGIAWAIAVEGLKNGRFALFGLGPGQFSNAFTAFKPLGFNVSENWNLRFASSSNMYFQLLTEVGLVGLTIYAFLTFLILKNALKTLREKQPSIIELAIYLSLTIILIIQSFLPLNFFLVAIFFVLLALIQNKEVTEFDLKPLGNLVLVVLFSPIVLLLAISFFVGKIALANHYFLQSLIAANQNDGVKTYNLQIKAIQTDSSSLAYRIAYSQTNFVLANSLAAKQDLSDNDRSTITQLIQQSIREAKAAVAVDPRSVEGWENLATIYRNLINFAEGADQWSVAAYQQAIALDPLNPRLRVDFGGLYFSLKNFDQAINLFAQATNLKGDYANAHYNLANALRERGSYLDAKREYEVTQSLIKIDTADYQKVTAELEETKKKIPSPIPTSIIKPSEPVLSKPTPPAAGIKPPLELPNEGPAISPTPAP